MIIYTWKKLDSAPPIYGAGGHVSDPLIRNEQSGIYYCEDLDSVDSFCVLKLFYVEELKQ